MFILPVSGSPRLTVSVFLHKKEVNVQDLAIRLMGILMKSMMFIEVVSSSSVSGLACFVCFVCVCEFFLVYFLITDHFLFLGCQLKPWPQFPPPPRKGYYFSGIDGGSWDGPLSSGAIPEAAVTGTPKQVLDS